jgi:hypothetical protein
VGGDQTPDSFSVAEVIKGKGGRKHRAVNAEEGTDSEGKGSWAAVLTSAGTACREWRAVKASAVAQTGTERPALAALHGRRRWGRSANICPEVGTLLHLKVESCQELGP